MSIYDRLTAAFRALKNPTQEKAAQALAPTPFPLPAAKPGFLTGDVISRFSEIKGYFNEDDCMHFYLLLRMQSELGLRGDILEIGSYFGRSTALLVYCLKPGERLVVCDSFRNPTEDHYSEKPTEQDLLDNIRKVNPSFNSGVLEIHSCLSTDLRLNPSDKFKFIHIDGGHSHEIASNDLNIAHAHVTNNGIIAVDDYEHEDWPGVTTAVNAFMLENKRDYEVLADMNRHIAKGRKLYLIRKA